MGMRKSAGLSMWPPERRETRMSRIKEAGLELAAAHERARAARANVERVTAEIRKMIQEFEVGCERMRRSSQAQVDDARAMLSTRRSRSRRPWRRACRRSCGAWRTWRR